MALSVGLGFRGVGGRKRGDKCGITGVSMGLLILGVKNENMGIKSLRDIVSQKLGKCE